MRVGIGLRDVFALDKYAAEGAVGGGVEHVGQPQTRFALQLDVPLLLEYPADPGSARLR